MARKPMPISEIAENAKELGAIRLDELMYVMAEDETYDKILSSLCKAYNLDDANNLPPREDRGANSGDFGSRVGTWFRLLARFARTSDEQGFYFKDLPARKLLPLYDFQDGKLTEVEGTREFYHYVKIEDLKEFLDNTRRRHKIAIHLPPRLSGDRIGQEKRQAEAENVLVRNEEAEETFQPSQEGLVEDRVFNARHFRPYHQTVVNLIGNAVIEIEDLYAYVRDDIGWLDDERDTDRKESALSWFEEAKPKHIERSYLESSLIYFISGRHSKRDVIGTFCKELISCCLPDRLPEPYSPKKSYGIKPLYNNLYRKLRERIKHP